MKKKEDSFNFFTAKISIFEFSLVLILCLVHALLFLVYLPKESKGLPQDYDQLYPNCMPCKKVSNSLILSSTHDYIFTFAYEPSPDYINFFQSLRSAGYIGKIVAFTKSYQTISNNTDCGVEVVLTSKITKSNSKQEDNSISDSFRKYIDTRNYMLRPDFFAHRVAIVNASRVYFLKDPFGLFPNPNRLFLLRSPVSNLPFGFNKGPCSELWTERDYFYDNAIIAGGSNHVRRFLDIWTSNPDTERCWATENDRIILSNYGEYCQFGPIYVHVHALYYSIYDITPDPDSFLSRTNFGEAEVQASDVPTAIIDWKKSGRFKSVIEKRCNTELQ